MFFCFKLIILNYILYYYDTSVLTCYIYIIIVFIKLNLYNKKYVKIVDNTKLRRLQHKYNIIAWN